MTGLRERISKLQTKRHSSKKIEHILKKHAEKASRPIREHEKIQAIIDGMKDNLKFETKNRRQTKILTSKLFEELTEAKKSAKRFLNDYEKEKKAWLFEDVRDQLAKEAGEDSAEVEESKRESMRTRVELENERKMLKMAEVWREERVRMKLTEQPLKSILRAKMTCHCVYVSRAIPLNRPSLHLLYQRLKWEF